MMGYAAPKIRSCRASPGRLTHPTVTGTPPRRSGGDAQSHAREAFALKSFRGHGTGRPRCSYGFGTVTESVTWRTVLGSRETLCPCLTKLGKIRMLYSARN